MYSMGKKDLLKSPRQPDADIVVTAIVGSRGLNATLAAINAGKDIGLANKETLVTAGHIVMKQAIDKRCADFADRQ